MKNHLVEKKMVALATFPLAPGENMVFGGIDECRRNLIDSLPRGMTMVVDESVEVHVRKPDGDTERKRQRLDRFRSST